MHCPARPPAPGSASLPRRPVQDPPLRACHAARIPASARSWPPAPPHATPPDRGAASRKSAWRFRPAIHGDRLPGVLGDERILPEPRRGRRPRSGPPFRAEGLPGARGSPHVWRPPLDGGGEATAFIADEDDRFTVASVLLTAPPPPALPGTGSPRGRLAAREPSKAAGDAPLASPLAADSGKHELLADRRPAATAEDARRPPPAEMERVAVRNGDSLYLIFNRKGLSQTDLHHLLASGEDGKKLKRLRPGQSIGFTRDADGRIARFHHEVDQLTTVQFTRSGDGFTSRVVTREYDRRVAVKNAVIESSLFAAARGAPDPVVHQLVDVLEWDIDFARDLRKGDTFSLLYEELYIDGRPVRAGNVLALEFRSRRAGETIRAFRYTDSDGDTDYFTPDGRSLRREFMRNPLRFTRISSRFSKSRLHPVLRVRRPHRGVDYAAPRGTPVRATGSGRVSFAGRKGGYGKTILLAHGNAHTTLYAHLSRYAKGVRRGTRVRQGQVIGYVGSTGVSTGPHLHYEFRVNGVHRDPLTVKLPRAAPLDENELKKFRRAIGPLAARIESLGATQLAGLVR